MLEVSDSLILAQEQSHYPITKAIYSLLSALGNGQFLASALGVWAMLFLADHPHRCQPRPRQEARMPCSGSECLAATSSRWSPSAENGGANTRFMKKSALIYSSDSAI